MPASFQPTAGIIRFGPEHKDWRTRDPWAGVCSFVFDQYDAGLCHLFGIAGKVRISDHRDILRLMRDLGFERMQEVHNGQKLETDLAVQPFKRRKI